MIRTSVAMPLSRLSRTYATRRAVKPPPKVVDPLTSSSNATVKTLPDGVTFIHRPPPSAPTPFSTTMMPASPLLRSSATSSSTSTSTDAGSIPVPPRMRRERNFPSNCVLTESDFESMRELRASNPDVYTRKRLAKEFNCSPFLVAQKVPLDRQSKREKLAKVEAEHEEIRSKWGERKYMVKTIQKKRREYW